MEPEKKPERVNVLNYEAKEYKPDETKEITLARLNTLKAKLNSIRAASQRVIEQCDEAERMME